MMCYFWDWGGTGHSQPDEGFEVPTQPASNDEAGYSAGIAYAEADPELKEQALANEAPDTNSAG